MLVIKHKRIDGFGKFFNVAILKGDEIKIVDESKAILPGNPEILASLLSFSTVASGSENVNVLVQMAVSMRAHNRGGMLLVVPTGSSEWQESIIQPISYAVSPAFSKLSELIKKDLSTVDPLAWQGAMKLAVDGIAGLTAADGATIINDQYELLAFGAKIGRSDKSTRVERVIITEPVEGNMPQVMHPAQNGGTRHLSAAQFVHDQHNALALVASQDGRFTVFAWSESEDMVHAHRVDVLFL
jgi:DNA integrity scanning protein DisA with diadenylate cyclase activity